MGGLFGLLSVGMSAISANAAGAGTVARNTTNVGTEGYTKESVELQATIGAPFSAGVRTGPLTRSTDLILTGRERSQSGSWGRADDLVPALTSLESSLAPQSGGLVDSIANFFGSLTELSSAPTDPALRSQVLDRADAISRSFQGASRDISNARAQADERVRGLTQTASNLAQQIATLNRSMAMETDPALADQRDLAAKKLAEIVGGSAHFEKDGSMRFVLDDGTVAVDGTRASQFQVVPDNTRGGHLAVQVVDGTHTRDVTGELTNGRIGAQLYFRDTVASQAQSALDQLAYDMSTQINLVHRASLGLDGNAGRNLFVEPTQVAGAAAAFAVDPAVAADPRLLATAGAGAGLTDTQGLDAMIAFRDSLSAGNGTLTFTAEAIRTIGAVGAANATAKSNLEVEQARTDFLTSLRDSISGVDPNEELMKLAEFQHASEAANKFVATINEMMQDLIQRL